MIFMAQKQQMSRLLNELFNSTCHKSLQ